jgi:hypothetical protein
MSVALLAHGEIVPRRGTTRNCGNCAAPGRSAGAGSPQACLFVVLERTRDVDEVNEPRLDRPGARLDAADAGQHSLGTKCGQRTRTREREERAV